MAFKKHGRQYDVVVLGATGYTGQLTAEHISKHLPTNLRWAVAGRSKSKLEGVVEDCKQWNSTRTPPSIEIIDVTDEQQLTNLVKKTFILITTVGPYTTFGEKSFKACAETGTHYLDVTGEFPWVGRMIKKYEKTAMGSGALMFPQIGIESAPADICTWAMAQFIRRQTGAAPKDVVVTIHKLRSAPSGGTLASLFEVLNHFSIQEIRDSGRPYVNSPVTKDVRGRPHHSFLAKIFGSQTVPELGRVTTSIAGITDATVVERTWGLLSQIPSKKDEWYGTNFTWAEYYKVRNWFHGVAIHWGLMLGTMLLALVPPIRTLVKKFVYQPGEGVARENMRQEEIEYRSTATIDDSTLTNQRAYCQATFQGSMYYLTGLFLSQAAWTLLEDDTGLRGGVFTAACLGQGFIDRCHEAGFRVEVKMLKD